MYPPENSAGRAEKRRNAELHKHLTWTVRCLHQNNNKHHTTRIASPSTSHEAPFNCFLALAVAFYFIQRAFTLLLFVTIRFSSPISPALLLAQIQKEVTMDTPSSSSSSSTNNSTASSSPASSTSSISSKHEKPAEETPEPNSDLSLALALARLYIPPRVAHGICTHSRVARVYAADMRCQHCRTTHLFGWVYRCRDCQYRACHNCRPKYVERSWDSIWGVLREES
jgi:hypothetical protein